MQSDLACERCNKLEEVIYEVSMMAAGAELPGAKPLDPRLVLRTFGKVMDEDACKRWGL